MKTRILALLVALGVLAALAWGAMRLVRAMAAPAGSGVAHHPRASRPRRRFRVAPRGQLQGGNSETIEVPMTGVDSTGITFLREPGELVKQGDVIVQFDTTQQEFNLREPKPISPKPSSRSSRRKPPARPATKRTATPCWTPNPPSPSPSWRFARNPVKASMKARQNDIALEAARDRSTRPNRTSPIKPPIPPPASPSRKPISTVPRSGRPWPAKSSRA